MCNWLQVHIFPLKTAYSKIRNVLIPTQVFRSFKIQNIQYWHFTLKYAHNCLTFSQKITDREVKKTHWNWIYSACTLSKSDLMKKWSSKRIHGRQFTSSQLSWCIVDAKLKNYTLLQKCFHDCRNIKMSLAWLINSY